jgi:hypothetical protein
VQVGTPADATQANVSYWQILLQKSAVTDGCRSVSDRL